MTPSACLTVNHQTTQFVVDLLGNKYGNQDVYWAPYIYANTTGVRLSVVLFKSYVSDAKARKNGLVIVYDG